MKRARLTLGVATTLLVAAPAAAQWPAPPPPAYGQPAPPQQPVSIPGMPQVILPPLPVPGARETEQRLDQAKASDAGRRLSWFYADAHGGFEQIGLQTFSGGDQRFTTNTLKTSSSGAVVGAGIGARLLFLTLLVRGRIGFGPIGQFYRVGPEIGLHIPFGRIEPHVEIGGGFGTFAKLQDGGSGMRILGGYGRIGAGVDFFPVSVLSLGVGITAELLGLVRPAVDGGAGALATSASSIGGSIAATGVLGLHF